MIGQTVSHYRILEKLGEGGMGVVYKAEDLKLTRTVALKFLPHGLEANEPERSRFLQEARAAALLNHPNICTIHDIAESEGQQFIVMEFVDGKTLRELIPLKKMEDAISYAIQAAEALHEAHTNGIVHRDIKAENIMVNSKNQVKVMDFGLAKLKGAVRITKTSSTVGTLAYMAPEQIQGEEVDARSDVFSFGIVLYEMLTGHLPFRGAHEAALVYSIMNEEPTPLTSYLPDAPPELLHIINRALEKDREERYQSAHDLLIDLRRLKKDSTRVVRQSSESSLAGDPASPLAAVSKKKVRAKGLLIGAAILSVLCIIAVGTFLLRTPSVRLNPNYTVRTLYTATYVAPGTESPTLVYPGLSRDGNWLSFGIPDDSGKYALYFMNVSWEEPRKIDLSKTGPFASACISPNGEQIMFGGGESPIKIISSNGGEARKLADGFSAEWVPGGTRISYMASGLETEYQRRWEVWSVQMDGSRKRLEWADALERIRWVPALAFCWSPDGKSLGWIRNIEGGYTELFTIELKTGRERQLTFDREVADEPTWLSNGNIVFMSDRSGKRSIWAVSAEGGNPERITAGGTDQYSVSVSEDGQRMLIPEVEAVSEAMLADNEGTITNRIKLDTFVSSWSIGVSGDLTKFAVVKALTAGGWALSVTDSSGRSAVTLAGDEHEIKFPMFSPNGKWIAYQVPAGETTMVCFIQADHPGTPITISMPHAFYITGMRWIDSEEIVLFTSELNSYLCSVRGGDPKRVFEDSTWACPVLERKYLAYFDHRKSRAGGWIVGLDGSGKPAGKAAKVVPFEAYPFTNPFAALSPDGSAWLYTTVPWELWRVSLPGGKREPAVRPPLPFSFPTWLGNGGKRYACLLERTTLRLVLLENVFE